MAISAKSVLPLVGAPLLKRAKWSWLGYGAAIYGGLYLLRRFGVWENTADRGMALMEKGASLATGRDLSTSRHSASVQH